MSEIFYNQDGTISSFNEELSSIDGLRKQIQKLQQENDELRKSFDIHQTNASNRNFNDTKEIQKLQQENAELKEQIEHVNDLSYELEQNYLIKRDENTILKQVVEKANKCIEFYGNHNNMMDVAKDHDEVLGYVVSDDFEKLDFPESRLMHQGKFARSTQKEISELMKQITKGN